jgi:hypothetical protein
LRRGSGRTAQAVNVPGHGLCGVEQSPPFVGELQHLCAFVMAAAAALEQTFADQPPHHVGCRAPVDAGALHYVSLIQALVLCDRYQDGELPRGYETQGVRGEELLCALPSAVQQVRGRTVHPLPVIEHGASPSDKASTLHQHAQDSY